MTDTQNLIGTAKQIAWATTIRASALSACEQYLADARTDGEPDALISRYTTALDRLRALEHADAWIALRTVRGGYPLLNLVDHTVAGNLDGLEADDPKFFLAARLPR